MQTLPYAEHDYDRNRSHHFDALSRAQQAAVIQRMALDGYSELAIAAATRLAVEQIRGIVAQRTA